MPFNGFNTDVAAVQSVSGYDALKPVGLAPDPSPGASLLEPLSAQCAIPVGSYIGLLALTP